MATFRVFVSSTFKDFAVEREALQEYVFPALRRFCLEAGSRFEAVDLRWGISEEAGHDQRTMAICLSEIDRCQQVSPRPNFVVFLGNIRNVLNLLTFLPDQGSKSRAYWIKSAERDLSAAEALFESAKYDILNCLALLSKH